MAEYRHWHSACLTIRVSRIARLFTIKTRTEAWFVIYAIALGAVERGQHYLRTYEGVNGWILALGCTAVVFLAGAKLLDAVRPQPVKAAATAYPAQRVRRAAVIRSRPTRRRRLSGSASPPSPGTGSPRAR
jgi:hypothetical protein